MDRSNGLLKIGDFARAAGTNLRTLRYYEELGLLAPNKRSGGGFRYYRTVDLNRVRTIQNLQELGLTLEVIGQIMSCREAVEDRDEFLRRVSAALDRQEQLIAARMETLENQRRALAEARLKLEDCGGCDHVPTDENNHCEPCSHSGRSLPTALSALF